MIMLDARCCPLLSDLAGAWRLMAADISVCPPQTIWHFPALYLHESLHAYAYSNVIHPSMRMCCVHGIDWCLTSRMRAGMGFIHPPWNCGMCILCANSHTYQALLERRTPSTPLPCMLIQTPLRVGRIHGLVCKVLLLLFCIFGFSSLRQFWGSRIS